MFERDASNLNGARYWLVETSTCPGVHTVINIWHNPNVGIVYIQSCKASIVFLSTRSDIQEILGAVTALQMLFPSFPLWAGSLVTGTASFLMMYASKFGPRTLDSLIAVLMAVMLGTFQTVFYKDNPQWELIGKGFEPTLKSWAVRHSAGCC